MLSAPSSNCTRGRAALPPTRPERALTIRFPGLLRGTWIPGIPADQQGRSSRPLSARRSTITSSTLGPLLYIHHRGKAWAEVETALERLKDASDLEIRLAKRWAPPGDRPDQSGLSLGPDAAASVERHSTGQGDPSGPRASKTSPSPSSAGISAASPSGRVGHRPRGPARRGP